MSTIAPYGSWRSPIAATTLADFGTQLLALQAEQEDLYWLELRPAEKGRSVVVRRAPDGTMSDVTPPDFSARSRVHEYGGGAFRVVGDMMYFVNDDDQQIYRQSIGDAPEALTPAPERTRALRYADLRLSPDGRFLLCVRERHPDDSPANVVNEIITLDLQERNRVRVVAGGQDFYANPRFSPDGTQIAYVTWNHPNMPWDDTELRVAPFHADGSAGEGRHIAGGRSESVMQPEWHPDGTLYFISDRSDWWNLYRQTGDDTVPLFSVAGEIGYAAWQFDVNRYLFMPDDSIVTAYTQNGIDTLVHISADGTVTPIAVEGYEVFRTFAAAGDTIYAIAGGGARSHAVIAITPETGAVEVIRAGMTQEIEAGYIAAPQPITFPTTNGAEAHAFYYPPTNPHFRAPEGELPPLLVNVHGGPTGQAKGILSAALLYWTSRGFAVVDVNYGGSIGYGRGYRERLRDQWGIVDVDDAVHAAKFLIAQGLADPARVAIRGGSAGGYTTLRAVSVSDFFAAGASFFGIGDLETMAQQTHKFESRYLDSLIGAYPAQRERYVERSPITRATEIRSPLLIMQGLEDKVVPPNQAEDMVAALERTGTPYAYLPFEGEGHGFRRGDNITRSAKAELSFYAQVFGFAPADELEPLEITNLNRAE